MVTRSFEIPVADIGQLSEKLQHLHSRHPALKAIFLRFLPQSTISYIAFSNYGDAIEQWLAIFHQQLAGQPRSPRLVANTALPPSPAQKLKHSLEKLSYIDSFLGDEVVLAGTVDDPQHSQTF